MRSRSQRARSIRLVVATATALLIAGCATMPAPLKAYGLNLTLNPSLVARHPTAYVGRLVRWGGIIIAARNLAHETRFKVLAYPLDPVGHPEHNGTPLGRFLAETPGYLETMIYHRGRAITVIGRVQGVVRGKIGAASYTYPEIAVQRIYLWPRQQHAQPQLGVGIGIGIGG
ncbi:MAG: Slp family lipoprotein [Acidiferrobacteraceae bacterium]